MNINTFLKTCGFIAILLTTTAACSTIKSATQHSPVTNYRAVVVKNASYNSSFVADNTRAAVILADNRSSVTAQQDTTDVVSNQVSRMCDKISSTDFITERWCKMQMVQ